MDKNLAFTLAMQADKQNPPKESTIMRGGKSDDQMARDAPSAKFAETLKDYTENDEPKSEISKIMSNRKSAPLKRRAYK
jgi:hypothetical protein